MSPVKIIAPTLLIASLLGGCASGQKISELAAAQEPPKNGDSRIVVYRDTILGLAVQPNVKVDGRATGDCRPEGAFYVDVKPGKYEVSATTEVTRSVFVQPARGETAYVECSIGLGLMIGRPELRAIAPENGKVAIQNLVFTGQY